MSGTAHFLTNTDRSIGQGTWTYSFNPTGDVLGATVTEARFRLFIDYNNGASVDLGKVKIYLEAPDGDRDTIYSNANLNWWNDDDDGNDSDAASDYDISFWGDDFVSKTPFALDNAQVNGNWKLIVQNDTGKTLDLDFLEVWVDYDAPANLRVKDIDILGKQDVNQPVYIQTWIENTGDKWYSSPIKIEYLVEGKVVGTSSLPGGLTAGTTNLESQLHVFDKIGANDVEVRIVGATDLDKSDNTRSEYFTFNHNQPDLTVSDIKVTGSGDAGSQHLITATVENVGNATYWDDVKLEYLVDDKVIGTQTIGIAGLVSGIPAGWSNDESEFYVFPDTGAVDVEVRIAGASDYDSTNNSRVETYVFDTADEQPDLVVSDVRLTSGWAKGTPVVVEAFIENVGTESWNLFAGSPKIEYFVQYEGETTWTKFASDTLTFGLTPLFGNWETAGFTATKSGPFKVKVEVSGNDNEISTTNNSWIEHNGYDRSGETQKTLANSAEDVKLGAFLSHAIYGDQLVPAGYRDSHTNGLNDDYRGYLKTIGFDVLTDAEFGDYFRPVSGLSQFFSGGLFVGDQGLALPDPDYWQAQGLVAEGFDSDGKKTLTLTFRGTDPKDMLESTLGQAWTGNGQYDYYESMRPLIDAAIAYANDPANGIEKMVVSGHSLGGMTADVFAFVDSHRLKTSVDLTVVSLASAGINPSLLLDLPPQKGVYGQYDPQMWASLLTLSPTFYIGLSHDIDAVTYPAENPLFLPKIPNQTLLGNMTMDSGLMAIETPNLGNNDLPGFNFGAGHNAGLYWANVSQIMDDGLVEFFADHRIIAGVSDYSDITNMNGSTFGVFEEYVEYGTNGDDDDKGSKFLFGDNRDEFILGFSGDDLVRGNGGHDLLSGGEGNDSIYGGADDDRLSGGSGNDLLNGETGNDTITDMLGNDMASGGNDSDKVALLSGINDGQGDAGSDFLIGGVQADTLSGGTGNDVIMGEASSGPLAGSDEIIGGTGDDILMGGRGADVFVFNPNDGADMIAGFSVKDVTHKSGSAYDVTKLTDDFQLGVDLIRLDGFAATDETNVLSKISDGTDGAVLAAEGLTLTFYGVDASDLSVDDFLFA